MRHPTALLAALLTIGFTLACGGTQIQVDGERAGADDCPEKTQCWNPTPPAEDPGAEPTPEPAWEGLVFSGQSLYDTGVRQLGPVLEGGDFVLDFGWESGSFATAGLTVEIVGDTLDARMISSGQVELQGLQPGTSEVRVMNEAGELVDWLTIDTVELLDIEVVKVGTPEAPLIAGCEQMVGVRLVAGDVDEPLRAIDDDVVIYVDGQPAFPDPGVWDCFMYLVPADATEVEFEVVTAGQSFTRVLPVDTTLACPGS